MKKLLLTLGSVAAVAAPVAAVVACGGEEDKKVDNSKAAVAGQWTITVGGKVFTITGKADGTSKIGNHDSSEFVTFKPSAPTDAKLGKKTGLPNGYTVSITGTFSKTLKTLDLTSVNLTQTTAPNSAQGSVVAGVWTATVGGATVTITGKTDGTNAENLAAGSHDLTKFLVFTAPAMSPATASAKSTIPAGFTIKDKGTVGTTPIVKLGKIVEKTAPKEATE